MERRKGRPQLVPGEWVDTQTGEIHATPPIMVQPRFHWPEESVVVWQDAAKTMAKMPDLGAEALRVWLYVVGTVGYENILAMSFSSMGRELGMQRQNVSRAVAKLVEAEILKPVGKFGHSRTYKLNSQVGWRGSVKQLVKHRAGVGASDKRVRPDWRVLEGGKTPDPTRVEDQRQPELLPSEDGS